ncbi:MAG: hypothetical protein FJ276_20195 [Planctomycetes bacterium]|nr:hypothetical protein [Planctomycetota bacterium]
MKRMAVYVALVAMATFSGSAFGVETRCSDTQDCGTTCSENGWLIGDIEFLFLTYSQEGGVGDLDGNRADFDYELAPRFTFAYEGPGTLGIRVRYFDIDTDALSTVGNAVGVEAYYIDLEYYQGVELGCRTELEYSFGARYQDFAQFAGAPGPVATAGGQGLGGIVGLQLKREFWIGQMYARGRFALMMGDASITDGTAAPVVANDLTFTYGELGMGYEVSREIGNALLTLRGGFEWQHWGNVAVADTAFGGVGNDDVMEDAGFAGLAAGVGLEW